MTKALVAILVMLVGATSASAADLPAQIYTKAPTIADPGYNWTGAYVGGQGGARQTSSNWTALCFESGLGPDCNSAPRFAGTVQGLDSTGAQFGGYVGYNLQVGSRAVLGLEGDINWGHTKGSLAGGFPGLGGPPDTSVDDHGFVSTGWSASIRGRAGFLLVPSLLVYATGGVAFQQFGFNANCPATDGGGWCDLDHNETLSTTRTGYTAGFGVEQAFGSDGRMTTGGPWHARIEYRYSDFGSLNHNFFANTIDVIGVNFQPLTTQTVQLGISHQF